MLGPATPRRGRGHRWREWQVGPLVSAGFLVTAQDTHLAVRFDDRGRADRVRLVVAQPVD